MTQVSRWLRHALAETNSTQGHPRNSEQVTTGLPEGWAVMARDWGWGNYDALVIAPPPAIGWRTDVGFVPTARQAEEIAAGEARAYLRGRAARDRST